MQKEATFISGFNFTPHSWNLWLYYLAILQNKESDKAYKKIKESY